jgi:2-succinyl-5-enolpyruvyl-6-hydroxy-3-cyclohexene-1-carboxylate synthase
MTPQFQQTVWSRLLVETLVRMGVTHAVVSPGSRSTPLLLALLSEPGVRVHSIIDERSAGFVGIGLARVVKSPVLLLCTSGTAAANYLPAIVEADHSSVPLIVLTADRTIDAQNAQSPQTIDQTQLYGTHVRRYFELGEAAVTCETLRSFRRLLVSAVQVALTPHPGPVQLNARARKPLQPCLPIDTEDRTLQAALVALLGDETPRWIAGETAPDPTQLLELARMCQLYRRGLVVCGYDAEAPSLDPKALAKFASATGYPVWLDVAHPLRWNHPESLAEYTIRCAELLWGCEQFVAALAPDLIVQVGPIATSSNWESWLAHCGAKAHCVLARHGWPDPSGRASLVVNGDPSNALRASTLAIEDSDQYRAPQQPWLSQWRHCDARAVQALQSWAASERPDSELHAVRAVFESCPRGTCVVLGNSLPVREADIMWPAGYGELESFAIRGTNGIDGVLSTAVGVAKGGKRPVLALLGDISFLHDIGALHAARQTNSPLAIVVIDNQGGRIFEQLPVFEAAEPNDLQYWTTPHELSLDLAGAVYGIQSTTPSTLQALRADVSTALQTSCATLIVVRVSPSSARTETRKLGDAVRAAICEQMGR